MTPKSNAAHYRLRAERLRNIAATDTNRLNREMLEQVARDYDEMAWEAEARGAQPVLNCDACRTPEEEAGKVSGAERQPGLRTMVPYRRPMLGSRRLRDR